MPGQKLFEGKPIKKPAKKQKEVLQDNIEEDEGMEDGLEKLLKVMAAQQSKLQEHEHKEKEQEEVKRQLSKAADCVQKLVILRERRLQKENEEVKAKLAKKKGITLPKEQPAPSMVQPVVASPVVAPPEVSGTGAPERRAGPRRTYLDDPNDPMSALAHKLMSWPN